MTKYSKALAVLTASLLALFLPLVTGDHDGVHLINVCILAAGTILTWVTANFSSGVSRYAKAIVMALTASLVVLQSAISDSSVTNDEWKQIAVAGAMVIVGIVLRNTQYVPADLRKPGDVNGDLGYDQDAEFGHN